VVLNIGYIFPIRGAGRKVRSNHVLQRLVELAIGNTIDKIYDVSLISSEACGSQEEEVSE